MHREIKKLFSRLQEGMLINISLLRSVVYARSSLMFVKANAPNRHFECNEDHMTP